jgi:hypothetical protein
MGEGSFSADSWLAPVDVSTAPALNPVPALRLDCYPAHCSVTSSCVFTCAALAGRLGCRPAKPLESSSDVVSNPTVVVCWLWGLTARCSPGCAGQTSHYHHALDFVLISRMVDAMAMGVEVSLYKRPLRESSPQSSDQKSDSLSIRPNGTLCD